MIYAFNKDGRKIRATPKERTARCPSCNSEVTAKCGHIKVWHWAHKGKDPNCQYEGETNWHLKWKEQSPPDFTEVRITKGGMYKIADAVLPCGKVIEYQHSPISVDEIQLRESFYDDMVWVFDLTKQYKNDQIDLRENKGKHGIYYTFRWKHAKKTIAFCKKPVYLDLGWYMLRLKKVYPDGKCGGWGILRTSVDFANFVFNSYDYEWLD